jgi:hypothetical protein
MKKLTINLGANKERDAWTAMLRRQRRKMSAVATLNAIEFIDFLIKWGSQRNERYAKRPGTLKGRK